MDPMCWLIKQHHSRTIYYLCLPKSECRHLMKGILFNFLKYLHIAQSNGRAGVCPDSFKRVWMVHIFSCLGLNSLATNKGVRSEGTSGFAGAFCPQGAARWDQHQPGREFRDV